MRTPVAQPDWQHSVLNLEAMRAEVSYASHLCTTAKHGELVLVGAGSEAGVMSKAGSVVFLLDDDTRFVSALSALLQCNGFSTRAFTCVDDFLKEHDVSCPGCLILDVRMPGINGLELQSVLAARGITRPVIFLSAHGDIRMSVRAMKAGAVTFLPKPVRKAELLSAVEEALRADAVERQQQREEADLLERLAALTPRERQVLDLVLAGKLNKQIALELCTAEKTVKSHRGHIMEKLQVRSTSALIGLFARIRTPEPRAIAGAVVKKDLGGGASADSVSRIDPSGLAPRPELNHRQ